MPWLSAITIVELSVAEALSDALLEAGALSVDVSDADAGTPDERPIFDEPGGAPAPGWSRARVAALFPSDTRVPAALTSAFRATGLSEKTLYEVLPVEDDDWVRRTQAQFGPQEVVPGLWIVPTWHVPPDPDATNILLDPGLAFGTGTHPTTRLCLRWLASNVRRGDAVIDFGCGSGILAIAAAKLGAGRVFGVDIDAQAVVAARANAQRNAVNATFVSAAEELPGTGDSVVANILASPLMVLAPLLARLTAWGGRLALSGVLASQAEEVRAVYRAWYDFDADVEEDGWVLLSATRRKGPAS
jgi:ribosomal protein L11 methyltransferase